MNYTAAAIVAILVVAGLYVFGSGLGGTTAQVSNGLPNPFNPQQNQQTPVVASSCGDTPTSTTTINLINGENEAGAKFNATGYLYGSKGHQTSVSTTDGSGTVSLNCDEEYTLKFVRADGDRGDNSRITDIVGNTIPNARVVDGNVVFTPVSKTSTLNIRGSQHGVLQFKAHDEVNDGFMYDNADNDATSWELDGVTFTSTTDNATATAVGSGGEFHVRLDYEANDTITNFNDFGHWILIDAATTVYNEPSCKLDGTLLADQKGSFNVNEARQFSGYEYAYKVDVPVRDSIHNLDCNFKALAGVNPTDSDDIQVDFAAIGQYLSSDTVSVNRGAADDTATSAVVFTVQDVTFDLT